MRYSIAYYLLLFYALAMLNPLIPITADALSHTFAEAYHILTVHAKYGNNHLEKELAKTSEGQNKNQNSTNQNEVYAPHIPSKTINTQPGNFPYKKCFYVLNQGKILPVFLNIVSPPPKLNEA